MLLLSETVKIRVRHILLWVAFVLLAIYSLIMVSLIILKKVDNFDIFL